MGAGRVGLRPRATGGPIHGAPCCTTGGLPPPSCGKRFRMDLPSARPKPVPAPRPPPLSASLNKPSPLPQPTPCACPRLCIPEPPDRRYRGCTIVPSVCLPDTFRLAQEDTRLFYMDHSQRLRCARPCSTQPFCPFGLVCAQNTDEPDSDGHDRHQCSRCHEFDRNRESP